MSTTRFLRRTTLVCAIACALLASSASAADAQERSELSLAEAQEQYYMSYGEPEPLGSDGTPWLPIVLSVVGAVVVVAVSTTQTRRVRIRRRRAASSPA